MSAGYEEIRQQAMDMVRRAGMLARERLGTATAWVKEDKSPVTDVDLCQGLLFLDPVADLGLKSDAYGMINRSPFTLTSSSHLDDSLADLTSIYRSHIT